MISGRALLVGRVGIEQVDVDCARIRQEGGRAHRPADRGTNGRVTTVELDGEDCETSVH
jgi:hypothetical protein